MPETLEHRLWHCPAWMHLRGGVPAPDGVTEGNTGLVTHPRNERGGRLVPAVTSGVPAPMKVTGPPGAWRRGPPDVLDMGWGFAVAHSMDVRYARAAWAVAWDVLANPPQDHPPPTWASPVTALYQAEGPAWAEAVRRVMPWIQGAHTVRWHGVPNWLALPDGHHRAAEPRPPGGRVGRQQQLLAAASADAAAAVALHPDLHQAGMAATAAKRREARAATLQAVALRVVKAAWAADAELGLGEVMHADQNRTTDDDPVPPGEWYRWNGMSPAAYLHPPPQWVKPIHCETTIMEELANYAAQCRWRPIEAHEGGTTVQEWMMGFLQYEWRTHQRRVIPPAGATQDAKARWWHDLALTLVNLQKWWGERRAGALIPGELLPSPRFPHDPPQGRQRIFLQHWALQLAPPGGPNGACADTPPEWAWPRPLGGTTRQQSLLHAWARASPLEAEQRRQRHQATPEWREMWRLWRLGRAHPGGSNLHPQRGGNPCDACHRPPLLCGCADAAPGAPWHWLRVAPRDHNSEGYTRCRRCRTQQPRAEQGGLWTLACTYGLPQLGEWVGWHLEDRGGGNGGERDNQ